MSLKARRTCSTCGGSPGVSHTSVLGTRPYLHRPADLYLEGSDQHRGWFQSSLLTSVGAYGDAPYKAVLSCGFTVDENGRKMSKSIGNVIDPIEVCDEFGADVLRLWVGSVDYSQDMSVSRNIFERTSDAYRRIRNTFRYLLSNLNDFTNDDYVSAGRNARVRQVGAFPACRPSSPRRRRPSTSTVSITRIVPGMTSS